MYRKHAFSTRAWSWEPASFFQRRRPSVLTSVIVRSRARDRGRRRDTLAVLDGGPTTVASRIPAALLHGATRQGWSKGSDDAVTS